MGKFTTYDISLKGLIDDTQVIEYAIGGEFFKELESIDIQDGNLNVQVTVKNSNGIYDFSFKITGVITIQCDRCLGDLQHEVDTEYHLCVKHGEEFSDESDELLIIPDAQMELNVAAIIYDSVALTIPLKHNHPDGECDQEMEAYLCEHIAGEIDALEDDEFYDEDDELEDESAEDETDDDSSKPIDPRWEALKSLKK